MFSLNEELERNNHEISGISTSMLGGMNSDSESPSSTVTTTTNCSGGGILNALLAGAPTQSHHTEVPPDIPNDPPFALHRDHDYHHSSSRSSRRTGGDGNGVRRSQPIPIRGSGHRVLGFNDQLILQMREVEEASARRGGGRNRGGRATGSGFNSSNPFLSQSMPVQPVIGSLPRPSHADHMPDLNLPPLSLTDDNLMDSIGRDRDLFDDEFKPRSLIRKMEGFHVPVQPEFNYAASCPTPMAIFPPDIREQMPGSSFACDEDDGMLGSSSGGFGFGFSESTSGGNRGRNTSIASSIGAGGLSTSLTALSILDGNNSVNNNLHPLSSDEFEFDPFYSGSSGRGGRRCSSTLDEDEDDPNNNEEEEEIDINTEMGFNFDS